MTRECNGCTECCYYLGVEELRKPANSVCCFDSGHDCIRYSTRPAACESYSCLWLQRESIPEFMKPNESGILLSLTLEPNNPRIRVTRLHSVTEKATKYLKEKGYD